METAPGVEKQLGAGPGPGDHRQLGRQQLVAGLARVDRLRQAVDLEPHLVGPQAHHAAQPGRPFDGGLAVQTQQRLPHQVVAGHARDPPRHAVEQPDPGAVLAVLQADLAARRQIAQQVVEALAGGQAVDLAVVGLGELVAIGRAFQRVGEVGEQRDAVVDHVG